MDTLYDHALRDLKATQASERQLRIALEQAHDAMAASLAGLDTDRKQIKAAYAIAHALLNDAD